MTYIYYIYIFIHIPGITDNIIKIPVTFLKISFLRTQW